MDRNQPIRPREYENDILYHVVATRQPNDIPGELSKIQTEALSPEARVAVLQEMNFQAHASAQETLGRSGVRGIVGALGQVIATVGGFEVFNSDLPFAVGWGIFTAYAIQHISPSLHRLGDRLLRNETFDVINTKRVWEKLQNPFDKVVIMELVRENALRSLYGVKDRRMWKMIAAGCALVASGCAIWQAQGVEQFLVPFFTDLLPVHDATVFLESVFGGSIAGVIQIIHHRHDAKKKRASLEATYEAATAWEDIFIRGLGRKQVFDLLAEFAETALCTDAQGKSIFDNQSKTHGSLLFLRRMREAYFVEGPTQHSQVGAPFRKRIDFMCDLFEAADMLSCPGVQGAEILVSLEHAYALLTDATFQGVNRGVFSQYLSSLEQMALRAHSRYPSEIPASLYWKCVNLAFTTEFPIDRDNARSEIVHKHLACSEESEHMFDGLSDTDLYVLITWVVNCGLTRMDDGKFMIEYGLTTDQVLRLLRRLQKEQRSRDQISGIHREGRGGRMFQMKLHLFGNLLAGAQALFEDPQKDTPASQERIVRYVQKVHMILNDEEFRRVYALDLADMISTVDILAKKASIRLNRSDIYMIYWENDRQRLSIMHDTKLSQAATGHIQKFSRNAALKYYRTYAEWKECVPTYLIALDALSRELTSRANRGRVQADIYMLAIQIEVLRNLFQCIHFLNFANHAKTEETGRDTRISLDYLEKILQQGSLRMTFPEAKRSFIAEYTEIMRRTKRALHA